MNFKTVFLYTLILVMIFSGMAVAQDRPGHMPRGDEHFKELMALRNTTILIEMGLSAQSEKGTAIIDLLAREGQLNRNYHQTRHRLGDELYELMQQEAPETEILALVERIEENERSFHEGQLEILGSLKALLTPVERAQFYAADEKFRSRLQRIMRSRRGDDRDRGRSRYNRR
jgi:Spy/CpxP family protein refolding chaperone